MKLKESFNNLKEKTINLTSLIIEKIRKRSNEKLIDILGVKISETYRELTELYVPEDREKILKEEMEKDLKSLKKLLEKKIEFLDKIKRKKEILKLSTKKEEKEVKQTNKKLQILEKILND